MVQQVRALAADFARTRGSRLDLPPMRTWPAVARALQATAGLSWLSPRVQGTRSCGGGHGWMARLNAWVACLPIPSVTFMVKLKAPAAVGAPASSVLLSLWA